MPYSWHFTSSPLVVNPGDEILLIFGRGADQLRGQTGYDLQFATGSVANWLSVRRRTSEGVWCQVEQWFPASELLYSLVAETVVQALGQRTELVPTIITELIEWRSRRFQPSLARRIKLKMVGRWMHFRACQTLQYMCDKSAPSGDPALNYWAWMAAATALVFPVHIALHRCGEFMGIITAVKQKKDSIFGEDHFLNFLNELGSRIDQTLLPLVKGENGEETTKILNPASSGNLR